MPIRPTRYQRSTMLLLLVVMLLTGSATALAAQTPSAVAPADQLAAVQPQWRDELSAVIESASAAYTIDAQVHLPTRTSEPQIRGSVEVKWTNTTDETIDALPFRLYANGPDANHDALRVSDVMVDGTPASTELTVNQTVLSVALDAPRGPGESATVAMSFVLAVPIDERAHYGILNIDAGSGTWALAHWYPILAGWDPDRGWVLDPPSEYGDPIFSTTASYDLTLRTPAAWRVVHTGVTVETSEQGALAERHIVTGPVRDITLVLDDDFESVSRDVDGTTITSWYEPGNERVGEAVLDYAAQALEYFNGMIGPYPYMTLELAPVNLFGAAGVEFPQLIYMGASYYTPERDLETPNSLDFTVAHEVVHQWFYGIVGNNQYDHAFIDEGLTNFLSSEVYFTEMYGPLAGEVMVNRYLRGPFESAVAAESDQVVDTPTDDFPTGGDYVYAAYSKGPMGFKAIYDEIGHDAFAAGLQRYYDAHRFTVASPDDLLAAFEEASGQDLTELWHHWFEEAAGEDDV